MNALAHRLASGHPVRRRVVAAPPRAIRMLAASLLATAGVLTLLQRLADRIG